MISFVEQHINWQQQRCGKFTASEISKLFVGGKSKSEYFGKGALTYIKTKLAEILTGDVVEVETTSMEWGNSQELEAVLEFEKLFSLTVDYYGKGNPKFFPHDDNSGSSPDGIVKEEESIVEIKAPYNSKYHVDHLLLSSAEDLKKENFDHYAQIQMNLLCTGKTLCYFISYDPRLIEPRLRMKILKVYRDEEFITEIKERISEATKQINVFMACADEETFIVPKTVITETG